jgi:hypothetical protein
VRCRLAAMPDLVSSVKEFRGRELNEQAREKANALTEL